ncbi:MAG: molecular chaperone HtpG, partial [Nevskiaceae bacterium]
LLDDLAANKPEQYAEFWKTFGSVLKEGVIEDDGNRERVAKLLRFASSTHPDGQTVTLADYVARMKPEQKSIYYITADTLAAAKNSPHLEGFVAKGYEVLLLSDRIDEWLTSHLREFEGKKLDSVARSAKDIESAIETPEKAANESAYKDTLERLKKVLAGKVGDVRLSARLTESPACLVADEYGMSLRMARMMKAAGQNMPFGGQPIFEINAGHPLVARLKDSADETSFAELAELLHDQAVLAEGGQLDDPASFVKRLNKLILDGLSDKPRLIL